MRPGSLLERALLGTARTPAPAATSGTPADALVERLPADVGPERRLLLAAGAAAVWARAGVRPAVPPALPPADADARAEAPPRSAQLLAELLEAGPDVRAVVPEALARLGAAGLRAPARLLPRLLALEGAEARAAVRGVLDARGAWLARHHPAGAWVAAGDADALGPDAEARWQEGTAEVRVRVLRAQRRADAGAARGWLEAAWRQERAELRALLLAQLEEGLSDADAPLLTQALGDRSAGVRAAAADLLTRLPGSPLAQRMAERARALVQRKGRGLSVELPPERPPRDWEADGLVARAAPGLGERAHLAVQVLALVPPASVGAHLGLEPRAVVKAAWAGEWGLALSAGLTRAAVRFGDAAWAEALWDGWAAQEVTPAAQVWVSEGLASLWPVLPPSAAAARVPALLDAPGAAHFPVAPLVRGVPAPWEAGAAERFLTTLAERVRGKDVGPRGVTPWSAALAPAALALPPAALTRARAVPASGTLYAASLQAFHAVVAARQRLHEEPLF